MKRKAIAAVAALLLSLSAAGCAGKPAPAELPTEQAVADEHSTLEVNQNLPRLAAFSAQTIDGGSFTAEDLKNSDVTMINFWATYCPPCIKEMPELAALAKELPENASLVTYCCDAAPGMTDTALSIMADAGLDAATLIAADGDLAELLTNVMYIPTTVFVDRDGNIIGSAITGAPNDPKDVYLGRINEALASLEAQE